MKTEAQQQAILAARTSGLSTPKLVVITAMSDPADPTTGCTEASDVATTNRPTLSFNASGVQNDDANNKATITWPAAEMRVSLPSGATVVRLGIASGTGALGTALKSVSDTPFSVTVPANGELVIPANSQTSSEQ